MNDTKVNDKKAALRNLSRRTFLPGLILGIAGLNTLVIRFFIPKAAPLPESNKRPRTPRFPVAKVVLTNLGLSPGFYLNPSSGVMHYLSGGPASQFKKKEKNGLTPVDPTHTRVDRVNPRHSKPRVNLSRSSYFFEQAAAAAINEKQIDRACTLLIYAIEFELHSAYRTARQHRFLRFKQSPSFRLYDLLAGVSVRFNKPEQMKRMVELIKSSKDPKVGRNFDSRIKKWQDSNSHWRQRWTDTSKPVSWTVIKGLVLLM